MGKGYIKRLGRVILLAGLIHSNLFGEENTLNTTLENITSSNQSITPFPEDIPQVRKIEKEEQNNSSYQLVHIKQTHPSSIGESTSKEKKLNEEVQKEIYSIVKFIQKKYPQTPIYGEITKEKINNLENEKNFLENLSELARKNPKDSKLLEKLNIFRNQIGNRSAIEKLYLEDRLEIKPGQTEQNYKEAIAATKDYMEVEKSLKKGIIPNNYYGAYTNFKRKVYWDREKYLLENVAAGLEISNSKRAIVIYGGDHNFASRAEKEWNLRNKDKFSVITITPQSYPCIENSVKNSKKN